MPGTQALRVWLVRLIIMIVSITCLPFFVGAQNMDDEGSQEAVTSTAPKIHQIIIEGNKTVPTEAIKARLPYRVGHLFKHEASSDAIRSIYSMGFFQPTIRIIVEELSPTMVDLYIQLEEKNIVEDIIIEGNDNFKQDEIEKKLNLTDIRSIDVDDLSRLSQAIKELYIAKDYHDVAVTAKLVPVAPGRVRIKITVNEGPRSFIKRIIFKGNQNIPSKKLRKIIFTRQEWLFGFLDKSGTYQKDMLQQDRYIIEHYYKSQGFLHAHVDNVHVERDPESPKHFIVTFYITEGEQYTISALNAPGNEFLTEEEIIARIPIRVGDLYSSEKVRQAVERLRLIWGEFGYVFADIIFNLEVDESRKTVELFFTTELGSPVTSNRIRIIGNRKTHERVIRREITFNEGELLTTRAMDDSRSNVERLGYFDPRLGVNWKIKRISDTKADLDLVVNETKTGQFFADLKWGGDGADYQSPARSVQVGFGVSDINFLGTGIKATATAYFSRQDRQIALNVVNPWLFDRPLRAGFDLFHRTSTYSDFRHVEHSPREQLTGGSGSIGFFTKAMGGLDCLFDVGIENIHFKENVRGRVPLEDRNNEDFKQGFQRLVDRVFQSGSVIWATGQLVQDYRNNPVTPSRGYLWNSTLKIGIPHQAHGFGYIKWDADAHWYTPIINEYDLILHLHGHAGFVQELGSHTIPYRELYHIGGPSTVRGFLFGQIGPTLFGDSLGGKKAFWMNAELIFPITKDFNMVGLVFYDGGAGWDTPDAKQIDGIREGLLRNNQFNFRQTVGFGVKLRSPTPISIAVGFKLDHNKRSRESSSEVHFTSAVDF